MKKNFAPILTAAVILGMTSSGFAAANPFSDVPSGHWAYNAVTKLASEGVIEGYGDGTFRGNRNITRYEMAQMIARALAKAPQSNMSAATRADLDKLAAEFRDELDSLGVRVAELEKHADKVKWTGEIRYRYNHDKSTNTDGTKTTSIRNQMQIRLFPTAYINENWTAKARFTATNNFRADSTTDAALTYVYAEGKYGKFTIDLGRMPLFSNADKGMVVDDNFSGGRIIYGDKVKLQVEGGRWKGYSSNSGNPADYFGAEVLYDGGKFDGGVAYRYFKGKTSGKDSIISLGAGYKFTDMLKLSGAYAHNSKAISRKNSYNIELTYGNLNRKEPGTWSVGVAYRYISAEIGLMPTYSTWYSTTHKRGVDFELKYTPVKNSLVQLNYFTGKTLGTRLNDRQFYGRVSWFF